MFKIFWNKFMIFMIQSKMWCGGYWYRSNADAVSVRGTNSETGDKAVTDIIMSLTDVKISSMVDEMYLRDVEAMSDWPD